MLKFVRPNFPTLVLSLPASTLQAVAVLTTSLSCILATSVSSAIPSDPSPDFVPSVREQNTHSIENRDKRDSIEIITPPGEVSIGDLRKGLYRDRDDLRYFYRHRHELGLQVGSLYDTEGRKDNYVSSEKLHQTLSIRYQFPDHKLQTWEASGTFITDGTGTLSVSRRLNYTQERFRPYSAIGIGLHIFSDRELANFLLWRQYQARFASGFELTTQWWGHDFQWRMELALALSARSQQADASVGYVWPF